jgi:DNA-binding HxlR family transcriptional regulator
MIEPHRGRLCEVLHRTYDDQNCSIARTLEIVGERWTILILRDAFLGVRRFDDFQRGLGVSRGILAGRLDRLCDEGILERRRYRESPQRFEYRLTEKGRDLWPVLMSLMNWGDTYEAEHGPPKLFFHRECGGELTDRLTCVKCGEDLTVREVEWRPGPGASGSQRGRRATRATA